jgi:hypothetical protein
VAGVEVCLFDAVRGVLTPVGESTAIRFHTWLPEMSVSEPVELGSMRPLAVYELLRRVLEHEGLSGMFVFQPQKDGETMFKQFGERALQEGSGALRCPGTRDEGPEPSWGDAGRCIEMVLLGSDGPVEQPPHTARSGPKFRDALEQFGYPALVVHLLSAHYSQPLDDPLSGLPEAHARVERIRDVAATLRNDEPSPPEMGHYLRTFRLGLGCDLDTRLAFRVLFEWLHEAESREDAVGDRDLREMLALLELEELAQGMGVE